MIYLNLCNKMDNKRNDDIERLLQRMREENKGYREHKQGSGPKKAENDADEEDEYHNLQSRYREDHPDKNPKKETKSKAVYCEDSDSEEIVKEKSKKRLKRKSFDAKAKKNKLIPQPRVKESKQSLDQKKEAVKSAKKKAENVRPKTARVVSCGKPSPTLKKKKSDTVALFLQREKQWKADCFLKTNLLDTREGRKLNLALGSLKGFEVYKKKDVHEFIKNEFVPPHEKRRDDVRLQTRAKMMVAQDY